MTLCGRYYARWVMVVQLCAKLSIMKQYTLNGYIAQHETSSSIKPLKLFLKIWRLLTKALTLHIGKKEDKTNELTVQLLSWKKNSLRQSFFPHLGLHSLDVHSGFPPRFLWPHHWCSYRPYAGSSQSPMILTQSIKSYQDKSIHLCVPMDSHLVGT